MALAAVPKIYAMVVCGSQKGRHEARDGERWRKKSPEADRGFS